MTNPAKNPQLITMSRLAVLLILCNFLSGCFVAGYSSGGGWFIWPGSIGLLLVILLIGLLLRR